MKYFSMFSGIGGFELGILRSQYAHLGSESEQEERSQGRVGLADEPRVSILTRDESPLCIGYSEIDKYAIKVYERNFNGHKNYGDATNINAAELPDFDLLVGGFPCQAFSIAGKRAGFNDTRGTLFFDIARILKEKQPRHLVLENVKGLLSHDSGRTFQTVLGVLADLGYLVEWQVLNSKDFGVPQNRERVYIVGHLGGECEREVFPITGATRQDVQPSSEEQSGRSWVSTLDSRYGERWSTETYVRADEQDTRRGGGKPDSSNGIRRTSYTDGARVRRLTPKECERLQGFPDDWTLLDDTGGVVSDTQRYKMCGNAVTVNVVQAVLERLCNV
jgi:DNA (cytosine-5)-methyltransferase 1